MQGQEDLSEVRRQRTLDVAAELSGLVGVLVTRRSWQTKPESTSAVTTLVSIACMPGIYKSWE